MESADLLSHLPELCDFIDQARAAGGAVYVHCAAGVSRSATVRTKASCDFGRTLMDNRLHNSQ